MFFHINVGIQGEHDSVIEKFTVNRKEVNDTENLIEHASVEDLLNMHRAASNKTTLISENPNIINEENVIVAPGQRKLPVSILRDKLCEV